MPGVPSVLVIYYAAAALAGLWVLVDGRTRLAHRPAWEVVFWALGVAIPATLPIFLPMYLLGSRAPDRSGLWGPAEIIGIAIFFGLTLPLAAGLAGLRHDALTLGAVSAVILVQNAGFVLLSVLGIAVRYRLPLERLGLTARRWGPLLAAGLVAGALMVPVSAVAERAGVEVYALLRGREAALRQAEVERRMDPLNRVLEATEGPAATAWLLVLLGVVVPVGEEVYFRGVVYGGLRNRFGRGWAVVGSTLFFGVVHRQVVHFLPIAVLGLVLALLYERAGSLLPPVAVHAVNNVVSVLARIYGWEI